MVNYAREYGIDLDKLWRESPGHPQQMANHRFQRLMSDIYWETMRSIVNRAEGEAIEEKVKQYKDAIAAPKPARSRRRASKPKQQKNYQFTKAQMELARRSLDCKNDSQEKIPENKPYKNGYARLTT